MYFNCVSTNVYRLINCNIKAIFGITYSVSTFLLHLLLLCECVTNVIHQIILFLIDSALKNPKNSIQFSVYISVPVPINLITRNVISATSPMISRTYLEYQISSYFIVNEQTGWKMKCQRLGCAQHLLQLRLRLNNVGNVLAQ